MEIIKKEGSIIDYIETKDEREYDKYLTRNIDVIEKDKDVKQVYLFDDNIYLVYKNKKIKDLLRNAKKVN